MRGGRRGTGQNFWIRGGQNFRIPQQFAALATLGRRVLVTGDPKQLGPVVLSKGEGAEKWLARSPFELRDPSATEGMVFLDQQSRMAKEVCTLVSNTFYRGKLQLADEVNSDRTWKAHRNVHEVSGMSRGRLNLIPISTSGAWNPKWHGYIRPNSANKIAAICRQLQSTGARDILILTPFRAQRALIRAKLAEEKVKNIHVWTVHRAQGSEHHTVIFDPVIGSAKSLTTPDARRLINVALSRAQARIILLLSPDDERNPTLHEIATVMRGQPLPWQRGFVDIAEALAEVDKLEDLIGRGLIIGDHEGKVIAVEGHTCQLQLRNGEKRWMDLSAWMQIVRRTP